MVDKMNEDRIQLQRPDSSRKFRLSPEVAEFLHMLDALEARALKSN